MYLKLVHGAVPIYFCYPPLNFTSLHVSSFEQMMTSLENVSFRRGDVVFAEGDDVDASPYMYVLGSGKVR